VCEWHEMLACAALLHKRARVNAARMVLLTMTSAASVEARCRTAGIVKTILVQDGEEVWELQPLMIVTKKT